MDNIMFINFTIKKNHRFNLESLLTSDGSNIQKIYENDKKI